MHNDPIEENLPWITPWFTKADPVGLKLNEYDSGKDGCRVALHEYIRALRFTGREFWPETCRECDG